MTSKPIAVLGAGAWGTALAITLAKNNNDVCLWSHEAPHVADMQAERCNQRFLPGYPLSDNIAIFADLSACLEHCQDVLIAVPSSAFRSVLISAKPYLSQVEGVVWASKGLDPDSGNLLHHVVEQILGNDFPTAVLSGPSFASEVAQAMPTAITLACQNEDFAARLSERFQQTSFRAYRNQDLIGVQIGGVVKNVLAIATGISDALGFGANARCAIITRGLAEMIRLGEALGAERDTLIGLAGMGDLILTCTDNQSRNRRFGLALGEGKSTEQAIQEIGHVVEGAVNAKQVFALAKRHQIEMPICRQIYEIINQTISAKEAVTALLTRPARVE